MSNNMTWTQLIYHYDGELADPRTKDWFLVKNPLYIMSILVPYLYVCLKIGPKYMEKRQAYSLKKFIFVYNILQILVNSKLVYSTYYAGWSDEISLGCEPVRRTTRPIDYQMVGMAKMLYLIKIVDLVETGVFVLRKKHNQLSFLHLYHHISSVLVAYFCVKYTPGGMMSLQGVVNGSVHVIMYTYYLLSSLGPSAQTMLGSIKRYITTIQIVQFLFLIAHQSQAFFPSCPVPKIVPSVIVGNIVLNLLLFLNFWKKNYSKRLKVN